MLPGRAWRARECTQDPDGAARRAGLAESGARVDVLLLPKVESEHELVALHEWLPEA